MILVPIRLTGVFMLLAMLAACSTMQVEKEASLPKAGRWVLLPVVNHSQTPQAGERVEALVETALRVRGLEPRHYPPAVSDSATLFVDEERRYRKALEWARKQGFRYGVTGSVEEWRYKSGLDGEPAVGISLRVIDVPSGRVLWAASGSRSGWGYESVSGTAGKLVQRLVASMQLVEKASD